jgi:hypothetical protein
MSAKHPEPKNAENSLQFLQQTFGLDPDEVLIEGFFFSLHFFFFFFF